MHACENPRCYHLFHLLQREFRLPVLCFSQVWIFSAPTIQFYTFLGLDIGCGSGNIMTHLSTFLRWIKLIKLPAFPSCLHQKKLLLPWVSPASSAWFREGWRVGCGWGESCRVSQWDWNYFLFLAGLCNGLSPRNWWTKLWETFHRLLNPAWGQLSSQGPPCCHRKWAWLAMQVLPGVVGFSCLSWGGRWWRQPSCPYWPGSVWQVDVVFIGSKHIVRKKRSDFERLTLFCRLWCKLEVKTNPEEVTGHIISRGLFRPGFCFLTTFLPLEISDTWFSTHHVSSLASITHMTPTGLVSPSS